MAAVGAHSASRPSAIASSASPGRSHACSTTSSPWRLALAPGGSSAAKNRASNRRGIDGGVTHRDIETRRSVRRWRSSCAASAWKWISPPTSALRGADGRRRDVACVREEHPGLLERLADRADVLGDRPGRRHVAAERGGGLLGRDRGPGDQARVGVGRVHAPAREDVDIGGERHRRRPAGEQHLGPGRAWPKQDEGRGRTWLARVDGLGSLTRAGRWGGSGGRADRGRDRFGRGGQLGPQRLGRRHRQAADEARGRRRPSACRRSRSGRPAAGRRTCPGRR